MKNIIIKVMVISLSCTQIIACSGFAGGSEFSTRDSAVSGNQAKVIVYRNYRLGDKCQNFDVKIDNRSIGTLKCSGFVSSTVAPVDVSGVIHESLFTQSKADHFTSSIKASAGRVNYFQLTGNGLNGATAAGTALLAATGVGFSVVQYQVVPVSERTAISQLKGLKQSS